MIPCIVSYFIFRNRVTDRQTDILTISLRQTYKQRQTDEKKQKQRDQKTDKDRPMGETREVRKLCREVCMGLCIMYVF